MPRGRNFQIRAMNQGIGWTEPPRRKSADVRFLWQSISNITAGKATATLYSRYLLRLEYEFATHTVPEDAAGQEKLKQGLANIEAHPGKR